jgi:hypothetical protein
MGVAKLTKLPRIPFTIRHKKTGNMYYVSDNYYLEECQLSYKIVTNLNTGISYNNLTDEVLLSQINNNVYKIIKDDVIIHNIKEPTNDKVLSR